MKVRKGFLEGRVIMFSRLSRDTRLQDRAKRREVDVNCSMSPTTLDCALERHQCTDRFTAHGFRATASTTLNEAGYRSDLIERQLAHAERNKTRASFNQAEYLPERRQMMQHWADMVDLLVLYALDAATPGSYQSDEREGVGGQEVLDLGAGSPASTPPPAARSCEG